MKKRLLFILVPFILNPYLIGQTDTQFWFAVPYSTMLHDPPLTADLTLTATELNKKTTVTISQPYNPQIIPITVVIDPAVSLTANVHFTQDDVLKFSNNNYNTISNSALLISSDYEITAYYETSREKNNPALFTLKGKNALGYDFWTPFQNRWPNHSYDDSDPAFSQIIIVATEDNTVITVNLLKDAFGLSKGIPFEITLDMGQTFMLVPKAMGMVPSVLAADRLTGTHITSTKPIAVTIGDDSVQKLATYDFMGDQCIPTANVSNKSLIGKEYIVMKGKITDASSANNEKVFVLTTKPNTIITITRYNGTIQSYTAIDPGSQITVDLLKANSDYYVHIMATEPVYVLHITGISDELAEAIVPAIDGCTGSLSVNFTRPKNDPLYLNLMTKYNAIDSFYISINGAPAIPFLDAGQFEQADPSDWYVLKDASRLMSELQIPTGAAIRIFNTKNTFHLGLVNGVSTGGGCVYGFLSDYNEMEISATVEDQGSVFQVCSADSIQLRAKGGIRYHWSPTEYLNDSVAQNPILLPPPGEFEEVFTVYIEHPCHGMDILQVCVIKSEDPSDTVIISSCNSYTDPDGTVYTTSGFKTKPIVSISGCVGTHTIDLTILESTSSHIMATSCSSYIAPDGAVYTTSGTKTAVIPNAAGCDSIITIELTINKINNTIISEGNIIIALESGASYQWFEFSNGYIPLINENNRALTVTKNGSYAVEIVKETCADTSAIEEVSIFTMSGKTTDNEIQVYPNPTNGIIQVDIGDAGNKTNVVIFDVNGNIIKEEQFINQRWLTIELNAPSGVYYMSIISKNKRYVLQIVKM